MPDGQITTQDVWKVFRLSQGDYYEYLQVVKVAEDEPGRIPKVLVNFQFRGKVRKANEGYPRINRGSFPIVEQGSNPTLQTSATTAQGLYVQCIRDITDELDKHPDCKLGRWTGKPHRVSREREGPPPIGAGFPSIEDEVQRLRARGED